MPLNTALNGASLYLVYSRMLSGKQAKLMTTMDWATLPQESE